MKSEWLSRGLSAEDVADLTGLSKDTVANVAYGRSKTLQHLLKISKALDLGLTAEDLSGKPNEALLKSEASTDITWLPILDIRASMGNGSSDGTERVIARWGVPDEDIPAHKGELKIITAVGDSMTPTVLPNQKVIIDTGHTVPSPEGIYAIHDGDDLTLKRVARDLEADEKTYIVSSDNPQYKSYRLKDQGQASFRVVGRMIATWVWS